LDSNFTILAGIAFKYKIIEREISKNEKRPYREN